MSASAPTQGAVQKLDINLESPFIKVVQECIVKSMPLMINDDHIAFKSHKKYIEKEVSNVVNKITLIKKAGAAKGAGAVIESLDT